MVVNQNFNIQKRDIVPALILPKFSFYFIKIPNWYDFWGVVPVNSQQFITLYAVWENYFYIANQPISEYMTTQACCALESAKSKMFGIFGFANSP